MDFFRHFPTIDYDLDGSGNTKRLVDLTRYTEISAKILDDVAFYSYYSIPDGSRPDTVSLELYGSPNYYWTFFVVNRDLMNTWDDWPRSSGDLIEFVETKYPNVGAVFSASETCANKFEIGEQILGQQSNATGILLRKYPTNGFLEIQPTSGTFIDGEDVYGTESEDSITCYQIKNMAYAPHHHEENETGVWQRRRISGTTPVSFAQYEWQLNLERSRIRVIKPEFIKLVVREFIKEMDK